MKDIIDFAKDILNIELLPYQEEIIRKLVEEAGGKLIIYSAPKSNMSTYYRIIDEYRQFKKIAVDSKR